MPAPVPATIRRIVPAPAGIARTVHVRIGRTVPVAGTDRIAPIARTDQIARIGPVAPIGTVPIGRIVQTGPIAPTVPTAVSAHVNFVLSAASVARNGRRSRTRAKHRMPASILLDRENAGGKTPSLHFTAGPGVG